MGRGLLIATFSWPWLTGWLWESRCGLSFGTGRSGRGSTRRGAGDEPALFLHFWDCYTVLAVLLYCSVCISSNVIKKDGVGKQEEQNQTRCGERIPLAGLFLLWRIEVCWYQCDRKACLSGGYSAEKSAVLYGRHRRYQYGIIHT